MQTISLNSFLLPIFILSILFFFQVFVWRVFKPRKQMGILFAIYLGFPLFLLLVTLLVPGFSTYFVSSVFLLSLSVVYVQSFPGFQAVSPSLELINEVKLRESHGGASLEDIYRAMDSESLLTDRMEDLVRDGLASLDLNGKLSLKPAGMILAKTFFFYRKILGLPRGEG